VPVATGDEVMYHSGWCEEHTSGRRDRGGVTERGHPPRWQHHTDLQQERVG